MFTLMDSSSMVVFTLSVFPIIGLIISSMNSARITGGESRTDLREYVVCGFLVSRIDTVACSSAV